MIREVHCNKDTEPSLWVNPSPSRSKEEIVMERVLVRRMSPANRRSSPIRSGFWWRTGRAAWMGILCSLLLTSYTFLWAQSDSYYNSLLGYSLVLGMVLGLSFWLFGKVMDLMWLGVIPNLGVFMSGFLLFFVYLIGYIFIFYAVVSLPLNVLRWIFGDDVLVTREYSQQLMNGVLILSVFGWLSDFRIALRYAVGKKK